MCVLDCWYGFVQINIQYVFGVNTNDGKREEDAH